MDEVSRTEVKVGVIGLGAMGGAMARNLSAAGYEVTVFDLDAERMRACEGAEPAANVTDIVLACQVVLTSLPSSDSYVSLAKEELAPHARRGQVFVELGTTSPPAMRTVAEALADKGAHCLDAPVSGGPRAAENGTLYMFVGGQQPVFERCLPLLEVLGDPDRITYCGPAGAGQVVKGVNQLMMGLANAAYLEAVAFGVRAGVDADTIAQALDGEGQRRDLARVARAAAEGRAQDLGVKFRELPYFLKAAREAGFELPLTQRLWDVCEAGERVVIDDNREAPSFWHELMKDSSTAEEEETND